MTALRELKLRLPPERRGKGRSGTLATLQYALACVKQVQGEHCFPPREGMTLGSSLHPGPARGRQHEFNQVAGALPTANQEYYQQWSLEEGEPCAMDMSTYTLEELEHITSEYTLRNQVSGCPWHPTLPLTCPQPSAAPESALAPPSLARTPSRWQSPS